jgi:hypothetical protein
MAIRMQEKKQSHPKNIMAPGLTQAFSPELATFLVIDPVGQEMHLLLLSYVFSAHAVQDLEPASSYPTGQNVGAAVGFTVDIYVGAVGCKVVGNCEGFKVVGNCEGFKVGFEGSGDGRKLEGNPEDFIVGKFVGLLWRIVGNSDGTYLTMIAETGVKINVRNGKNLEEQFNFFDISLNFSYKYGRQQ